MLKTFVIILSHKESTNRTNELPVHDRMLLYRFIGDESLETEYLVREEESTVYLKVPDNYESLPIKVAAAMKFVDQNYGTEIDGVFKTDDDIELNLERLSVCIDRNKEHRYFGIVNDAEEHYSEYHKGKCQSEQLNESKSKIPKCKYCSGGGYYVSRDLLTYVYCSKTDIIYEDVFVGKTMNDLGIYPSHVPIKGNGAYWATPVSSRKRMLLPYCDCGLFITSSMRFCPHCNKRHQT